MFRLAAPGSDGVPLVRHLERVAEMTGTRPAELDGPECPECLLYLFEWFFEIGRGRGSSGWGPNPLGYRDLAAWADLTGIRPTPLEVSMLMDLDRQFMKSREKTNEAGKKP